MEWALIKIPERVVLRHISVALQSLALNPQDLVISREEGEGAGFGARVAIFLLMQNS